MKYYMTERLLTNASQEDLLVRIETVFKELCEKTERHDQAIEINTIKWKFLVFHPQTIKDTSIITAKPITGGFILQADVKHRPNVWTWFGLVFGLFTPFCFLTILHLVTYIFNVMAIRPAIERAFKRISDECSTLVQSASSAAPQPNTVDQLERLAQLKDKGVLSATEFDEQKAKLLATK